MGPASTHLAPLQLRLFQFQGDEPVPLMSGTFPTHLIRQDP